MKKEKKKKEDLKKMSPKIVLVNRRRGRLTNLDNLVQLRVNSARYIWGDVNSTIAIATAITATVVHYSRKISSSRNYFQKVFLGEGFHMAKSTAKKVTIFA